MPAEPPRKLVPVSATPRLPHIRLPRLAGAYRALRGRGPDAGPADSEVLGLAPAGRQAEIPDRRPKPATRNAYPPESPYSVAALRDPSPAIGAFEHSHGPDDEAIRAGVVEFLDRVEARERGRLPTRGEAGSADLGSSRAAPDRIAADLVDEARAEADQVLQAARTEAGDLIRRARGEAQQKLEWSRAQGANIVRRSEKVAADRVRVFERIGVAFKIGRT